MWISFLLLSAGLWGGSPADAPGSAGGEALGTLVFEDPRALKWPGDIPPKKPLMPLLTDLNRDGKPELFVCDGGGRIFLLRLAMARDEVILRSAEILKAGGQEILLTAASEPNLADVTGDGLPDLVLANPENRRVLLYPNLGKPNEIKLGEARLLQDDLLLPPNVGGRMALADWNRDGLLDLICADFDGRVLVLLNHGSPKKPSFKEVIPGSLGDVPIQHPHVPYVRFLDANSDGLPDLILGLNWGYISVYLNSAAKGPPALTQEVKFSDPKGRDLNVRSTTTDCIHPAFGDVDGDGVKDLIFGGMCADLFFASGIDQTTRSFKDLEKIIAGGKDRKGASKNLAGEVAEKLFEGHLALHRAIGASGSGAGLRRRLFDFCIAHISHHPEMYADRRIDPKSSPGLPWAVAQAQINLVELSDLEPSSMDQILKAFRREGKRAELFRKHRLFLQDNLGLGEEELAFLGDLLASIPRSLHDLRFMSAADFLGPRPTGPGMSGSSEGVNVFGMKIRDGSENSFPPDGKLGMIPTFCACAVHEVNHVVDAHSVGPDASARKLGLRKLALIRQALPPEVVFDLPPKGQGLNWKETKAAFRRLGYWDETEDSWRKSWEEFWSTGPGKISQEAWLRNNTGFISEAPQESFATLANQYFTSGELMLDLALKRWDRGIKSCIDQFLFFAEVYSCGGDSTFLYSIDLQGRIERVQAPLKRDRAGRILGIQVQERWIAFSLDPEGFVAEVTGR